MQSPVRNAQRIPRQEKLVQHLARIVYVELDFIQKAMWQVNRAAHVHTTLCALEEALNYIQFKDTVDLLTRSTRWSNVLHPQLVTEAKTVHAGPDIKEVVANDVSVGIIVSVNIALCAPVDMSPQ